jgi:hypothetical protein
MAHRRITAGRTRIEARLLQEPTMSLVWSRSIDDLDRDELSARYLAAPPGNGVDRSYVSYMCDAAVLASRFIER